MNDNEYKTVCDNCQIKTWYETERPCQNTIFRGCPTCGSHEIISKEEKCEGMLKVIDNSELDERFTPFYKSGERVEVVYKSGEKERFYLGKSTGWKPIYLTIKKSNSMGGEGLFLNDIQEIRGLGKYR